MVSGRKASFSSVEKKGIPRLFPHSFLLPILKTGTIVESFQSYGIFSVSQICRARFCRLEASSTLPCFRISADIPHLQAGALPFFVALIAFNSSSNSCFSSRQAMFGLCATVSKAQRSATLKFFKVVCKSTKNSSFHCRTVSPSKALSRFLGNCPPTPPLS